jgi:hypothetical protein
MAIEERQGPDPDEDLVRREEEAAATEAAAIGGEGSDEDLPESERPLAEAGEGFAEGFEESERELIENATHEANAPDPRELAGEPEADQPRAAYGEPDHVSSTERDEDNR